MFPLPALGALIAFQIGPAAPLTELVAAYPYGEPMALAATDDGRRTFVAPGAAISILDTSALAPVARPPVIGRIELPDASPTVLLHHRPANDGASWLYVAGGTQGLWRVGLCPALLEDPPAVCASYPVERLDAVGADHVWKRCVDLALVQGNAAAGAPLLAALFAARSDSAIGPTELRTYRLLEDGTVDPWTVHAFPAGTAAPIAVGTALAGDPGDPTSLYVALGRAGIRRVDLGSPTFSTTALPVPACPLVPCPAGEQVRDLALVRLSNGAGLLYAALEYGRVLEYRLGTQPIAPPTVLDVECGYPERVAAVTNGADAVVLAVATQALSAIVSESRAPYRTTGIWSDICVQPGVDDPNGPLPYGCDQVAVYVRSSTTGTPSFGLLETHPVAEGWGTLLLQRRAPNLYHLFECTNSAATAIRRIRFFRPSPGPGPADGGAQPDPQPAAVDLLATHVDIGFGAIDGVVSTLNPALTFFGTDHLGASEPEGALLAILPPPDVDIVPVPGTQALCGNTILPPPDKCPDGPNPYAGHILGAAHAVHPLDPTREVFLPGQPTWVRADQRCLRTNVECGPACNPHAPVHWIQDYLDPAIDPSRLGWRLASLVPGSGPPPGPSALDVRWWQIACPGAFDPTKSETIDYVHSDTRPEIGDLVLGVRGGAEHGLKLLRWSNLIQLSQQTCAPGARGSGERLPPPPLLEFHEARTHVEREVPGQDDQGQDLDPCSVNALCSPTPTFLRNLFNNRSHTFSVFDLDGTRRWVTAVAAGYVASGPSSGSVQQPPTCQWDAHYGKGMLVLYDVTQTIQGWQPPTLLRVALGPGTGMAGDAAQGSFWAVDTRTYGTGPSSRTLAFCADLLGRVVAFDVSGDRLYPPAGAPYLPDPSTGLPPTPLLAPSATIAFPLDPSDGLPQSCVDLAVLGPHVYCAVGRAGVAVIDVASPSSPQLVLMLDTPGLALGVATRVDEAGRDQLLVGDSRCGVRLYGRPGP